MEFSLLLWLVLFIVIAVVAVKLAVKISKIVVSIVSLVVIIVLVFAFLSYADIVDLGEWGVKEKSESYLSEGKEKVTGYVVEQGKELLDIQEEKEGDG